MKNQDIPIHTKEDFEKMREIGKYSNSLLNELENIIKPGISTQDLDDYAAKFIEKYNLTSACLGYKGYGNTPFPKNICTSVNYVVCHGIPNANIILKEGDIVSVDITLIKDGYHGDTCKTFPIGKVNPRTLKLIKTTKEALNIGIKSIKENSLTSDIGAAIEEFIKQQKPEKYSIVEDYCGHGTGKKFHQPPQIEHSKQSIPGIPIKQGMIFTIEPMINLGAKQTRLLSDNWTVITKDYSLSAQFEHTLGIGENGIEIFT